jgi:hypothetical protein
MTYKSTTVFNRAKKIAIKFVKTAKNKRMLENGGKR